MRLPTLFKQNRNKAYNYAPRYYNERKERIDKLLREKEAREKRESASQDDFFTANRKKSFRDDWKTVKSEAETKNSRIRFVVVLIFLLIFAYAAITYGKFNFV